MLGLRSSKGRAVRVKVPGGELYAEEHGEGPPLLLIQGLGQGLWAWRYQVPVLARHRRVITFDTRGTGRSAKPPGPYTIGRLAEDARTVLNTFDAAPAHVVGFSMGGYVALTLALTHADAVRSLVLAGTGGGGRNRVPRPPEVRAAFEEAFGLEPEEFGRRTMPYTFSPGWPERNRERFEEILAARLAHPTPPATLQAHAAACYGFYDTGCDAERIAVPTLVVHGDADLIVPVENGRMLAARLPGAAYAELSGRGHNLMLEDPDGFNELVEEFLTRVERS
jgi:3-oxoadipate enol-lactonase